MQRYFVRLSFKGTGYHGWQIQPNAITVQEVLEKSFSTILGRETAICGAGRTDTGVHASFFVCHLDLEDDNADLNKLIYGLNSLLPADISVQQIWKVPGDAHARFSALSRTYKYYISTVKDPFLTERSWYYRQKLDIDKMNEAASLLLYYQDFTSFSRLHTDVKTNLCKIFVAEWTVEEHLLIFTIKADRFLRNMVRAIVGTLTDVGREKISVKDFIKIIEEKNRSSAGASAPSQGLFLADIQYPDAFLPPGIFKKTAY
ncbi:MAG: tRNA pseudouridine(38-40) synthase TruA [Prolixibacteraceae bacterium]|nr:tRNA pseudouridine(38-40) synthase TruA [Prolixibacteraceae bacterium]